MVEAAGFRTEGRLLTLNSYENRVYQVWIEPNPEQIEALQEGLGSDQNKLVIKIYRPNRWTDAQILEDHQFAARLHEAEVPCVPPLTCNEQTLMHFAGFRFALFACRGGRTPDLENEDQLEWIGRFIGRTHLVGRRERFQYRETIKPEVMLASSQQILQADGLIPQSLRPAWDGIFKQAKQLLAEHFSQVQYEEINLHGDLHVGNILWTASGPHFVDLDDARRGPAVQDLWMLLAPMHSGQEDRDVAKKQIRALLKGYEAFADFDYSQFQLIEALRTLRMIQYSAWLTQRRADPAFIQAFPWFASENYWQNQILALREQVALLQERESLDLI